jgi:protein-disulfide isomerase
LRYHAAIVNAPKRHLLAWKGVPWAGGTLLLLVAAVGLYLFTGAAASEPAGTPPPAADDISFGPTDPQLSVVEYSDFQCPFCAEYATMLETLREKYGDRVQFVYRFYPLAGHEYASIAAKAAYAASLQGKFWEMHDLLFENQDEWSESDDPRPYFDAYAESIGLDLERFHADADAQATTDFIKGQAEAGREGGVNHTPWLVIGDTVVLPRSLEEFDRLIQEAL